MKSTISEPAHKSGSEENARIDAPEVCLECGLTVIYLRITDGSGRIQTMVRYPKCDQVPEDVLAEHKDTVYLFGPERVRVDVETEPPAPKAGRTRTREEVFSTTLVNLLGNELCALLIVVRNKLSEFDERKYEERLKYELRSAGLDSDFTEAEMTNLIDIDEGTTALRALLPILHAKIHSATVTPPRDYGAYWSD